MIRFHFIFAIAMFYCYVFVVSSGFVDSSCFHCLSYAHNMDELLHVQVEYTF